MKFISWRLFYILIAVVIVFNAIYLYLTAWSRQPNIIAKRLINHHFHKSLLQFDGKNLIILLEQENQTDLELIPKPKSLERYWLDQVIQYVKTEEDLNFMDIGAKHGFFSLAVAAFGRRVLSVDSQPKHIVMVVQSLIANGLDKHVDLFLNYIGPYQSFEDKGREIQTISIDDLLYYTKRESPILMRINHEEPFEALNTANRFFSHRNITAVLMTIYNKNHYKKIKLFFKDKRFFSFSNFSSKKTSIPNQTRWPITVLWKRS